MSYRSHLYYKQVSRQPVVDHGVKKSKLLICYLLVVEKQNFHSTLWQKDLESLAYFGVPKMFVSLKHLSFTPKFSTNLIFLVLIQDSHLWNCIVSFQCECCWIIFFCKKWLSGFFGEFEVFHTEYISEKIPYSVQGWHETLVESLLEFDCGQRTQNISVSFIEETWESSCFQLLFLFIVKKP